MDNKIKVFVVGDCHTSRVCGQHINANAGFNHESVAEQDRVSKYTINRPEIILDNSKFIANTNIQVDFWGYAGFKCFGLDFFENINQNTISSLAEDTFKREHDSVELQFGVSKILEADLIMPWMGYIDCRTWIPKYSNAELIVQDYVDCFVNTFPSKKIRFIEAFPQFEELNTYSYPTYPYDVRMQANNDFNKALHEFSKEKGLLPPVSQSVVYESVGSNTLNIEHARTGGLEIHKGTKIDGLLPKYTESVYRNISEEIIKTVNILFK
jgi:hypothetical protein